MVSVDVMGGDYAPQAIIQGALGAAKKRVSVNLFGPINDVSRWLDQEDAGWRQYPIKIVDAPDVITMDQEPVHAIRSKQSSSLVKAVASVAAGESQAVVSAGNSGALMAAATFIIGRQEGVSRPAIAGFAPSLKEDVLVLDLGANTECRPEHLLQFAQLGCQYMMRVTERKNPRIGLLANGHEEGKGSQLTKAAFALLKASDMNFIGNVEPQDIFAGKSDIVVCDGFVGNVLLKTMESVCHVMLSFLKQETTDPEKKMWADQSVIAISKRLSFKTRGGALLLGVKKTVVVCHGNADAKAIENAILFASQSSQGCL